MTQLGFYFDSTRCTGCKTCELACKDYKDLSADHTYRRVIDYEGGAWSIVDDNCYTQNVYVHHVSIACNHCESPICVHVCPTGAMHKDEQSLVWPDSNKCIGCGYCAMACPYHAPYIDRTSRASMKCDACKDRLTNDQVPICVEACPLRALDFGEMQQLMQKYPASTSNIKPLPDQVYTQPNLLIKQSEAAKLSETQAGFIANSSEIV